MRAADAPLLTPAGPLPPWGLHHVLDFYGAPLDRITDNRRAARLAVELSDVLGMTRFGRPWIRRFGKDPAVAGITVFQPWEDSALTGHLQDATGHGCLDIFTCQTVLHWQAAERVVAELYRPDRIFSRVLERGTGGLPRLIGGS